MESGNKPLFPAFSPCAFIIGLFWLGVALAACHPMPQDVKQAAQDALEQGKVQQDSGNSSEAMRLFKEAEHYGLKANQTLTVAHARYHIAQCLGYYADKEELFRC